MNWNRLFALMQLASGGVAALLVAVGYLWFNAPLQRMLVELDAMAANAETEMATAEKLLNDVDAVAESIQKAMPLHRRAMLSVGKSTKEVAKTIGDWENEIPGMQDISTDAAHICATLSAELPIRVPVITHEMKSVKFELPEVIPKTQEFDIPYPTATVETSKKQLSYPSKASVERKQWTKSLGSVLGRDLGSVSFDYPSGIRLTDEKMDLEYPRSIAIQTKTKTVSVPATPELKMNEHSFDIPSNIEVVDRVLMKDEKVLLMKSSEQLTSFRASLGKTKDSLARIRRVLEDEVQSSFMETNQNLVEAEDSLSVFRAEHIPSILADLKEQRTSLNVSRRTFAAVSGLIPFLFVVLGLIAAGTGISGGAKLRSAVGQPQSQSKP